jgi:gamma-glutamyltranspeptidase/glutathione hydrolase
MFYAVLVFIFTAFAAGSPSPFQPWNGTPSSAYETRYQLIAGTKGMVTSDSQEASDWGVEILRSGGNAVDAAVATAWMLSVTRPNYAALGGGGFVVFCPAPKKGKATPDCQTIDFRESAPKTSRAGMKLDQKILLSGVPGMVAGFLMAHQKWGRIGHSKLMSKPIQMAKNGFKWTTGLESGAADRWDDLSDEFKKVFGCKGKNCVPGTKIRQIELAKVLKHISQKGRDGFYSGWVAEKIAQEFEKQKGLITKEDLKNYLAVMRPPSVTRWNGAEIVTMSLPSTAGLLLPQLLGDLTRAENRENIKMGVHSVDTIHAMVHAMKLAYADRAAYLGDPEFASVPYKKLTLSESLDTRWEDFNPKKSVPVNLPVPASHAQKKSEAHTTHLSVIDREGNAVSMTLTVNAYFGSGVVIPGTGIVMNNEMEDFNTKEVDHPNTILPTKRPLSSMSPTLVRDLEGNNRIVVGAAGGQMILTTVYQILVHRLKFGMSLLDSIAYPRFHHQWAPDELIFEKFGWNFETQEKLKAMGYLLQEETSMAVAHGIERFPESGRVWGATDYRGEGGVSAE